MTDAPRPFTGVHLPGSERMRVAVMGVVLAALVYAVFFYRPTTPPPQVSPVITDTTPPPTLDTALLQTVRDESRLDRLNVEKDVLAHLLEKSMMVVPAVAKALGMPTEPMPLDVLRASPASKRGRYLWYKGKVEALDVGRDGHPIRGYKMNVARLTTQEGERIEFHFSVPPPEDLKVGDWARVEGFFMKLRDAHFPVELSLAPLLVGPEILPAYPDWKAVEALDPAVLAKLKDGIRENGVDVDLQQASLRLPFAQDTTLWHVASYARHKLATMTPQEVAALPAFDRGEQWNAVIRGEFERGAAYRLAGIFCRAHVIEARTNPLGIENWSEVWLYSRGFSHRPFAVWIPKHVGSWGHSETARCVGYFLKRYVVDGATGEQHMSPVFVAADIERVDFNPLRASRAIGLGLAAVTAVIVLIFFAASRRDKRATYAYEETMSKRRRVRRSTAPVGSGAPTS